LKTARGELCVFTLLKGDRNLQMLQVSVIKDTGTLASATSSLVKVNRSLIESSLRAIHHYPDVQQSLQAVSILIPAQCNS
jgi:hypothetical protein